MTARPLSVTPLPVVAHISRVVSMIMDRKFGNRAEFPLLTSAAVQNALGLFNISSHIIYGHAVWLEVLEDHTLTWAGAWGEHHHFWVQTQFGEVVDLGPSCSHKLKATSPQQRDLKSRFSAPMIWSHEIPRFYDYHALGAAEVDTSTDEKQFSEVMAEVISKCNPSLVSEEPDFLNEPIVCNDRRILDDSLSSFKLFDRAVSTQPLPLSPLPPASEAR